MKELHGKSIKVRIVGSNIKSGGQGKKVPKGTVAYTLGRPVSGDPPMLEIKPMIAGVSTTSVLLRLLEPVHPFGVKEKAIVIAGDNTGREVVVLKSGESSWSLAATGLSENIYAPREHLVVCSNAKI